MRTNRAGAREGKTVKSVSIRQTTSKSYKKTSTRGEMKIPQLDNLIENQCIQEDYIYLEIDAFTFLKKKNTWNTTDTTTSRLEKKNNISMRTNSKKIIHELPNLHQDVFVTIWRHHFNKANTTHTQICKTLHWDTQCNPIKVCC